jgi:hypothetical protein
VVKVGSQSSGQERVAIRSTSLHSSHPEVLGPSQHIGKSAESIASALKSVARALIYMELRKKRSEYTRSLRFELTDSAAQDERLAHFTMNRPNVTVESSEAFMIHVINDLKKGAGNKSDISLSAGLAPYDG